MLDQTTVKTILKDIPKETPYSMKEICDFVESKIQLSEDDLNPYTDTRPTNYPKWRNVVQKTVFHLKENGEISYPKEDTYLF